MVKPRRDLIGYYGFNCPVPREQWVIVEVTCGGCGRRSELSERLRKRLPPGACLDHLRPRLKCTGCGGRRVTFAIYHAPR